MRMGRTGAAVAAATAAMAVGVGALGLVSPGGLASSAEADSVSSTAPSTASSGKAVIRYVALGDSYTSAPGVPPVAPGSPPGCGRSASNYPHLLAAKLDARLTDVSCGGAKVGDFAAAQAPGVGPQFDALRADTDLVTVGIGGNDNDLFGTAIGGCAAVSAKAASGAKAPCRDAFGDTLAAKIASDEPNIRAALERIGKLAPDAEVFLVGYPAILPSTAKGRRDCAGVGIGFTDADIAYLDGVGRALNAMLADAAKAAGATFVDTYERSRGHDMCTAPEVRWIEPLAPASPAAPAHPNAKGAAAVSRFVAKAVRGA